MHRMEPIALLPKVVIVPTRPRSVLTMILASQTPSCCCPILKSSILSQANLGHTAPRQDSPACSPYSYTWAAALTGVWDSQTHCFEDECGEWGQKPAFISEVTKNSQNGFRGWKHWDMSSQCHSGSTQGTGQRPEPWALAVYSEMEGCQKFRILLSPDQPPPPNPRPPPYEVFKNLRGVMSYLSSPAAFLNVLNVVFSFISTLQVPLH